MPAPAWVAVYSLAVLLFSLAGGGVPLLGRVTHGRLQLYLSLSAGVMLGASFFHVMPDAFESAGDSFGWWMAAGVVGLFCIERFLAPHTHEAGGKTPGHDHGHEHSHDKAHDHLHPPGKEHDHHHDHGHDHSHAHDHKPAAPAVAGWAAVLGLTLHTFMNGVGLAGAIQFDVDHPTAVGLLPGLALFLAIVLHKPADALAISTVLRRKGVSTRAIGLVQLGFALMVPVGAAAFFITKGFINEERVGQLTGAALAFSAGTFIFIALSDLLPEVQFHRHDRVPLFLALLAGIALMGAIALLEPHGKKEKPEGEKKEDDKAALVTALSSTPSPAPFTGLSA
jgi:zinc and cadmium transporter